MTEDKILEKLRAYLDAMYQKDFDRLVNYFYKEDLQLTKSNMIWIAREMEPFGENEGLLKLFPGVESIEELANLSDVEFLSSILKRQLERMPVDKMVEMVTTSEIISVSHAEYIATVVYSMENVFAGDGSRIESSTQLILSEGEWYFLFRAGFEKMFEKYKTDITKFNEAKKRDQPEVASQTPDDEIEKFAVYGYKNYGDEVLIEPRFKDAGDFKDGLAAVKFMRKWGYINKYGEVVIKPAYSKAEEFYKKMAKVANVNDDFDWKWGLINTKGKVIVPLEYDEMKEFSNGMLAVKKSDRWGFVNKKGKLVIDCKYHQVSSFRKSKAQALYIHEDGNQWVFYIDKDGNELGEVPEDEVNVFYVNDDW